MTIPKIKGGAYFEGTLELACPSCGYFNLHSRAVHIYNRTEDSEKGLYVRVDGNKTGITTELNGNPSRRRHAISIEFECEHCNCYGIGPLFKLNIVQHKGTTLVYWENPEQFLEENQEDGYGDRRQ